MMKRKETKRFTADCAILSIENRCGSHFIVDRDAHHDGKHLVGKLLGKADGESLVG